MPMKPLLTISKLDLISHQMANGTRLLHAASIFLLLRRAPLRQRLRRLEVFRDGGDINDGDHRILVFTKFQKNPLSEKTHKSKAVHFS